MPLNDDDKTYLQEEILRLRRRINELSSPLVDILKIRGFKVYKKEPTDDLMLPDVEFLDDYYSMLDKYSFRLFLRDAIKYRKSFTLADVTRYATQNVTKGFLDYLIKIKLVMPAKEDGYILIGQGIKSFGQTLEWYIAEIFRREFASECIRGVKFKRPGVGGDYDIIAKIEGYLLYMEVKSSPPRQVAQSEIKGFLDRIEDLNPDISVFFMDTELRMKDKIVPMFEEEFLCRPSMQRPKILRLENELFHIQDKIFIINSKPSITANIQKTLARFFRTKQ